MKKILFLILLSVVLLAACSKSSAEASIEDPSVANDGSNVGIKGDKTESIKSIRRTKKGVREQRGKQ